MERCEGAAGCSSIGLGSAEVAGRCVQCPRRVQDDGFGVGKVSRLCRRDVSCLISVTKARQERCVTRLFAPIECCILSKKQAQQVKSGMLLSLRIQAFTLERHADAG